MIKILGVLGLVGGLLVAEEGISPRQFKIELAKNCQVLMLSEKPNRKAKKIPTHLSSGNCVENMGCIRNVTQKEIDSLASKKRYYFAWENPVWCRVAVGSKKGWVLGQFLADKPCEEF